MSKYRKSIISAYLQRILENYSQKVFESDSLADFYQVISGIMFEKQGYLAQAFLCYQSSHHPFAAYSVGYFYEKGLGGNKIKADKAKAFYLKAKDDIPEAKEALVESTQELDAIKVPVVISDALILPNVARELEISKTIENLIVSNSQKLNNIEFNQLLVGLMYEKSGYPVQAYLIYRNAKQIPQSLYCMAYLLEHGIGVVQQNIEKSLKYYKKAHALGVANAGQAVDRLETYNPSSASEETLSPTGMPEQVQTALPLEAAPHIDKMPTLLAKHDAIEPISLVVQSRIDELPTPLAQLDTIEPTVSNSLTAVEESNSALLLFSKKKSANQDEQETKLKELSEEFHQKRKLADATQQVLFASYAGIFRVLEQRAQKIDASVNLLSEKSLQKLLYNCAEIIKFDKKYPFSDYPGTIDDTQKIELQYCRFMAHYYLAKHAPDAAHAKAHKRQAMLEAQIYCELVGTHSSKEAKFVKNYYSKELFYAAVKKMLTNREFSQVAISVITLALARIHRNSNQKLFFEVISNKYKSCPIQSIKLSLDLMQSALTMANDEKTRKLVFRDIEFVKEHFQKELKAIQENAPDIVDTSRKAITVPKEEWEQKLLSCFEAYFTTIEELFVQDRLFESVPRIMEQISAYIARETNMQRIAKDFSLEAKSIEGKIKLETPQDDVTAIKVTPRLVCAY